MLRKLSLNALIISASGYKTNGLPKVIDRNTIINVFLFRLSHTQFANLNVVTYALLLSILFASKIIINDTNCINRNVSYFVCVSLKVTHGMSRYTDCVPQVYSSSCLQLLDIPVEDFFETSLVDIFVM